jgi:hypothetical protein
MTTASTTASAPAEDYRGFSMASVVLAVAGWVGAAYLIVFTIPGREQRWLFFVVGLMAVAGTAAPFVRYLNQRFARNPVPPRVLIRQSTWVGFYTATCAWLQIGRTLNLSTALLLAAGLGAIEWFLRMRERSRWNPVPDDEPA